MKTEHKDTFQRVTDQIIDAIEIGAGSYRMPWRTSGGFPSSPINAVSKRPYRGINILVLWATAQERGYTSGTWATYKQWQELGAQVRKGEKSAHVVFWKFFDKDEAGEATTDSTKSQKIPMPDLCVGSRSSYLTITDQGKILSKYNVGDYGVEVSPYVGSGICSVDRHVSCLSAFGYQLNVSSLPGQRRRHYPDRARQQFRLPVESTTTANPLCGSSIRSGPNPPAIMEAQSRSRRINGVSGHIATEPIGFNS